MNIFTLLYNICQNGERIVSALSDLTDAVNALNTSVSAEIKAITDALASKGDSVSASDVEAAVATLRQTAAALDAETAVITGAPAPTPPPAG